MQYAQSPARVSGVRTRETCDLNQMSRRAHRSLHVPVCVLGGVRGGWVYGIGEGHRRHGKAESKARAAAQEPPIPQRISPGLSRQAGANLLNTWEPRT